MGTISDTVRRPMIYLSTMSLQLPVIYVMFFLNLGTMQAEEALVMVGGEYFDGYMDNEVEVWSHSPDCELEIPSTPDSFKDAPGVSFFQDNVYVCGGSRVGTTHTHDICDVYSLTDKTWRQGPSLKSNISQNTDARVHMTRIGSVLLAAFENDDKNVSFNILDSNEMEWIETFPLDYPLNTNFWSPLVFDEKHVGIHEVYAYYPRVEKIHIINIEEAKEVTTIETDFDCEQPVMYNNNLTCYTYAVDYCKFIALTHMDEGFTNPTWTDLDMKIPTSDMGTMLVLDGMLTNLKTDIAMLSYWEDQEWKTGTLAIPRIETGISVMNCNE